MAQPLSLKECLFLERKFLLRMVPFWLLLIMLIHYDDVVKKINPLWLIPVVIVLFVGQLWLLISFVTSTDSGRIVGRGK